MRLTLTVSALALMTAAAFPAIAQQAAPAQAAAQTNPGFCPDTLTKKAREALAGYNAALTAGDAAKTAEARASAAAAAKSDVERCVLGQIDLSAAVKASDNSAIAAQAATLAANPSANKAMVGPMLLEAGKLRYNAKDFAGATPLLEQAAKLSPGNGEALILLADAHAKTGKADGPTLAMKAIDLEKTAGRKAPENWYKHGVSIALDAKSPAAVDLAREWATAYPSASSWHDAVQILVQSGSLTENDQIDLFRLQLATKSLQTVGDVGRYANLAAKLGYPGEAEAALKSGIATGAATASSDGVGDMLKMVQGKVGADKASLAADTAKALSAGNAKAAMAYGDANFGYGNYSKAADVYRAVLSMNAADIPTSNLRLGMSLAMAKDKAGASAALNKVTGPKAAIAKYWLGYLATQG